MKDPFLEVSSQSQGEDSSPKGASKDNKLQNITKKNIPSSRVKKGKWLSIGWVVGWCLGIGLFALMILFVILFSVIDNPDNLKALWLSPAAAKWLLQGFGRTFFGLLFFAAFWMIVVNLIKVFGKSSRKWVFVMMMLLGFLLLIIDVTVGYLVLSKIAKIDSAMSSVKGIIWAYYISYEDGANNPKAKELWSFNKVGLVAPLSVGFAYNQNYLPKVLKNIESPNEIVGFQIDCGNGQTFKVNLNQATKDMMYIPTYQCFYVSKGEYTVRMNMLRSKNWEIEVDPYVVTQDVLSIPADISLFRLDNKKRISLNDYEHVISWKPVIDIGKVPAKILFSPENLKFLRLADVKLDWDFDGDGKWDKTNVKSPVSWEYKEGLKVYPVRFRINWVVYSFLLRGQNAIEGGCQIRVTKLWNKRYKVDIDGAGFLKGELKILNESNGKYTTKRLGSKTSAFIFLAEGKRYVLQYEGVDEISQKKVSCESEPISTFKGINVDLDAFYQDKNRLIPLQMSENQINLKIIPASVVFQIDNIIPNQEGVLSIERVNPDGTIVKVATLIYPDEKDFKDTIINPWEYIYKFNFEWDDVSWKQEFLLNALTPSLKAVLKVNPQSWDSPLEVKLDATSSKVLDPNDKIIRYYWYWGDDTQNLEWTARWVVYHTYVWTPETKWRYQPKVIVETQKWQKAEAKALIFVQKPLTQVKVFSPSHPLQTAKAWEVVEFSIDTQWDIQKIEWFINWEKVAEGEGREYIRVSQVFNKPGTYVVEAKVYFAWETPLKGKINLVVE